MNQPLKRIFLILLIGLFPLALMAQNSMGDIKSRMKSRLPEIVILLKEGKVGENNVGLLEARKALETAENATMKEENSDRMIVFEAIGRRVKKSAEIVGKQQADDFARRAPDGAWIQKPDGSWVKK